MEDSLSRYNSILFPFIIGRYHKPIINKFNHPYYNENIWQKGSIIYEGKSYPVNNLKYDIENDKLIYMMTNQNYKVQNIALDENFVKSFKIKNSKFCYIKGLSNKSGKKIKEGYFEVVYDGMLKFLVRKKKYTVIDDDSPQPLYKLSTDLYLVKNGQAMPLKSMTKLLKLLSYQKKEMKRFVQKNRLTLNQNNYASASIILNHYENIP